MNSNASKKIWLIAASAALLTTASAWVQAKPECHDKRGYFHLDKERTETRGMQGLFGIEPKTRQERMVERMTEKLALTQQQQAEIKSLLEKRSEIRRAEREKFQTELRRVLTAEQIDKLSAQ